MTRRIAIDHCVIAVSDWNRSNAFYRDVLGAEVDQKDAWFGHYRFGDWQLTVHGPGFMGLNAEKPVEPGNSVCVPKTRFAQEVTSAAVRIAQWLARG